MGHQIKMYHSDFRMMVDVKKKGPGVFAPQYWQTLHHLHFQAPLGTVSKQINSFDFNFSISNKFMENRSIKHF